MLFNIAPSFNLSPDLGFPIASFIAGDQILTGLVDNILITDIIRSKAHYPLNLSTGAIAYDAVGNNDGSIVGGSWVLN